MSPVSLKEGVVADENNRNIPITNRVTKRYAEWIAEAAGVDCILCWRKSGGQSRN